MTIQRHRLADAWRRAFDTRAHAMRVCSVRCLAFCARSGGEHGKVLLNRCLLAVLCLIVLSGCGKTIKHSGTEQLVLSDAVDRSIGSIDFTPLAGLRSYLDTTYIKFKSPYFVNTEYITSSLRNQLLAAGCRLTDDRESAEIIIEPRIGSLGSDAHEVTYGIPSSNLISQAASLVPTAPSIPTIPEIALAKKDDQTAAAKIAVFAYDPETGKPIWQSGMSVTRSNARATWFFGVGPFQSGSIYEKARFAGTRLKLPLIGNRDSHKHRQAVSLDEEFLYTDEQPDAKIVVAPASDDEVSKAEPAKEENTDKGG